MCFSLFSWSIVALFDALRYNKKMSNVVINSEILRVVQGKVNRFTVQKAIQRTLSEDLPNLRLLKQLCALDLALEVEQTVLLDLDDRARNLNNPARLASTYRDLRALMKDEDGEATADGWDDLLSDACEVQDLPEQPMLEGIDGARGEAPAADVPPTGDGVKADPVTSGDGLGGKGSGHTTTPYPRTLRRAVVAKLLAGRASKAAIARDSGVSLATVNRWHKLHILDGKEV